LLGRPLRRHATRRTYSHHWKNDKELAATVEELADDAGIAPLHAAPSVRSELVELGRVLAFDKILSGNRDVSCMTCHQTSLGSVDGRSLPIGVGGSGVGADRLGPARSTLPRNVPGMFNLHTNGMMFWDGRINEQYGLDTPAGSHITPEMEATFEFGMVSAMAMFPVTPAPEMRGFPGQNDIADLPDSDFTAIWGALMQRLGEIPEYVEMFEAAYPGTAFEDMTFAHAGNAIAGFMIAEFESRDSPWDRFLSGKKNALDTEELEGALAFFDDGCANCHNGRAMSDFDFHNTGLIQAGPGQGDGPSGRDDFGRFRETGKAAQRYAFRTPPLRNVELTGPYGHVGQFATLESFVAHYVDPEVALHEYDPSNIDAILRNQILDNADEIVETLSNQLSGIPPEDVPKIATFLRAMTGDSARAKKLGTVAPTSVPSGLPLAD
jgi:cytochrome c peroxidase